jgi:tetratricopeptide (TPR) repeat protein/CRP-like cAMP-binding protein
MMAGSAEANDWAAAADRTASDRLSPAQAHSIIRQRLERLFAPWGRGLFRADIHGDIHRDIHRLIQHLHVYSYSAGEIILPHGAHADCLGLIVQGQVAVCAEGRRTGRPRAILLPGSVFGEAMLVHGRASTVTLQATGPCEIWFLRRAELQALVAERRARQQAAVMHRLRPWAGAVLGLCLIAGLVLSVPSLRRAVAVVPMGLGQWCSQRGDDFCARQSWTLAAGLAPADANPLLALGSLYFARGDIGAAERSFDRALALAPESAEVYNNLGLIYAGQGEHERAVSAFQKALELQPGTAAVEQNLASSLQALGQYDEALSHYQAALALAEPQASTLVNLAITYYQVGQPDQAMETAREALRRDENLAPAYAVLGAAALEARRPQEALLDLQQAIALDGEYSQAYFYLGLVYKSLGQPDKAIDAFEQALATAADEATRVQIRRHLNELYDQEPSDGSSRVKPALACL